MYTYLCNKKLWVNISNLNGYDGLIHNSLNERLARLGKEGAVFYPGHSRFCEFTSVSAGIRKSLRRELLFKRRWKSVTSRGEASNGTIDNKITFRRKALTCYFRASNTKKKCQTPVNFAIGEWWQFAILIAFKISSKDHHNILTRWWRENNTTRFRKIRLDNTIART